MGKKRRAEPIPGDKRRDGKRPRMKPSFFDTLPLDMVAHVARLAQHATEKRTAANGLALLRAGGSLTEGAKLAFIKWTDKFDYISTRQELRSKGIERQEAEKVDGLYLSTRGDKEFDLLSEVAEEIGESVFQLTVHVSIITLRYIRFIRKKLPNVCRLIVFGDLYCEHKKFEKLLRAFNRLEYLELRDLGCTCAWLPPLAAHIRRVKKLRLVSTVSCQRLSVPYSLTVVWNAANRKNSLLEEVEIAYKRKLDADVLREDLLQKLPNVRYCIE